MSAPGHIAFGAGEHAARVAAVAEGVRARGLDAVLAWSRGGGTMDSAANVLWLTGFYNPWLAVPDSSRWSGQSRCAALVTAAGECVLVTNIPAVEWQGTPVFADHAHDEPYLEQGVAVAVAERGLQRGRIGVAGRTVLDVELHERLLAALPEVRFEAAEGVLLDARRVLSPAELEVVRDAGRIGSATMDALLRASVPGASERDAAAAAQRTTIAAGGVPYSMALGSGPEDHRYGASVLPNWSSRPLEAGDLWHCDLTGARGGYIWDFARTTVVGERPEGRRLEMIEAAIATVEAVLARVEPGRPVGDAVAHGMAVRRRLAPFAPPPGKHDYPHLGHTLGVGFGDVWLYEEERRPFEAGMYLAVEAVVAVESGSFAMFEENAVIGTDAVEIVTTSPKRPWEEPRAHRGDDSGQGSTTTDPAIGGRRE